MGPLSLSEIAEFTGGKLIGDPGSVRFTEVATDTRSLAGGEFFVALVGDRFDAHDFLDRAVAGGAGALLVSRVLQADPGIPYILVEDTLVAFHGLARGVRARLGARICGITGSSGKTSTKDMIASVLEQSFKVSKTAGNFNNHIGVPLTIFAADPATDWGVWELGMSNPGEIAPLAEMIRPDLGVITNIGVAHLEFMGSREAIAAEKGALLEALPEDGCALIPAGDDFVETLAALSPCGVLRAGIGRGDIRATDLQPESGGTRFGIDFPDGQSGEMVLRIPGRHMVENALLAAAVGWKAGLGPERIAEGLAAVTLTGGRLQRRQARKIDFLDDSYNANPESMRAALETLADAGIPGQRIAVLGLMAELGAHAEPEHRRVGESFAALELDHLLAVGGEEGRWMVEGALAAGAGAEAVHHLPDCASAATALSGLANPGDLVLLKGSRAAAIEGVWKFFSESESESQSQGGEGSDP